MRIPQRRIASALFSSAAVALLGFWYIYLFVGSPERQSAPEHALSLLAFSFAESGAPWHFALLTVLPLMFAFLAAVAWRAPPGMWRPTSWVTVMAIASTALVLLVLWEAALFSTFATYLAVSQHAG
jgi:hypothetical protein